MTIELKAVVLARERRPYKPQKHTEREDSRVDREVSSSADVREEVGVWYAALLRLSTVLSGTKEAFAAYITSESPCHLSSGDPLTGQCH